MKKLQLSTILVLGVLLASCSQEMTTPSSYTDQEYSFVCKDYENASEKTKSKHFSDNQNIGDVNIWVYDSSTKTLSNDGHTYYSSFKTIKGSELFKDPSKTYDVFVFTNIGKDLSDPQTIDDVMKFSYNFPSYDSFSDENLGFPMECHRQLCPNSTTDRTFICTKLTTMYNVKFQLVNDKYEFSFKDRKTGQITGKARVVQASNYIKPFLTEGEKPSRAKSKDDVFTKILSADELDVSKLTSKAGQELYMLENWQEGALTSKTERCESNLKEGYEDITTYIEFSGWLRKKGGAGFDWVTCRYYFGKDYDCGMKRNLITDLTLTITESVLDHDKWTVDATDYYNTGEVIFDPASLPVKGDGNYVEFSSVTSSNYSTEEDNLVEYKLDYNNTDWNAAGLSSLECRKTKNDTWKTYNGGNLTGPYQFRVKSNYSGSTQKTVKMNAVDPGDTNQSLSDMGEIEIDVKKSTQSPDPTDPTDITVQTVRDFWLDQIESYFEDLFSGREFTTAFRDFPFTSDWYKNQLFKDWDYEFDTDIWTAIYDAIPTYISQMNGNNFVNIYMNNFYAATADIEFDMNSLSVLHNGGWNEGTVRVNGLDQTAYNSFQYYLIYDESKLSVQYKYNNSWMTYSTAFGSHGEIVGGLLNGNTEIRVRSIGTISSAQQVSLSACYDAVGSTKFIAKPCSNINLTIRTVAVTRTEVENWVKTTLDDYIESEFYGRELTTQIKDFGLKPEELSEIMRAWDNQYSTDVWTDYYDYVDNPHIASLQYNKFSTLIDRFMDLNR